MTIIRPTRRDLLRYLGVSSLALPILSRNRPAFAAPWLRILSATCLIIASASTSDSSVQEGTAARIST
jgi:hypothetical protein